MSRSKKGRNILVTLTILAILFCLTIFYADRKTLKEAKSQITLSSYTNPEVKIIFPTNAEAAVMVDSKIIDNQLTKQLATASTIKTVTALMVLQKYPLKIDQQGPLITMTANDEAIFAKYSANGGSNVKVINGGQISEYQALQAILLPSSCNMSDSLAIWAFGSLTNYAKIANQTLKQWGINETVVGIDAGGLSPDSISTPSDLIKIGRMVLDNPVLAQIVNQKTANIPVQGIIKNVNWLLGTDGIIGIKTGNNDEDKGAFLFASTQPIPALNSNKTIIGAVMGSDSLENAMSASLPIIDSAKAGYRNVVYPEANQVIGYYSVPWSSDRYEFVATKSSYNQIWGKTSLFPVINVSKASYKTEPGSNIGTLSINNQNQNIVLNKKIPRPSLIWEIKNIFKY